jgi:4-diphosphocytidyl-2C-methyl-D-erythritol kinase
MTLVSSANNMGSDVEFIIRGQAFIHIMNNRGPKIDPWETPCFSVPQPEKKIFVVLGNLLQLSVSY